MNRFKVVLLVKQILESKVVALYVREDIHLPFVPTTGMQFKQGISNLLWETKSGELMPKVQAVTYDLDEEMFVCLLTVDEPLTSGFWTKVKEADLENSIYPAHFQSHS